jgi:hypothetical protein
MKPTVPFEVMMSAKAIKEAGDEYRAYPLQIAIPDGRGAFRTLVCADVIADWIVANCDGLPEPERPLLPLTQRREPSVQEAAAELLWKRGEP